MLKQALESCLRRADGGSNLNKRFAAHLKCAAKRETKRFETYDADGGLPLFQGPASFM